MAGYDHREVESVQFMGERIDFVATNDRLRERATALSHEDAALRELIHETRPDDVVWDVGACLGIHTLTLAEHLSGGEVVAFEPMPTNRGVLMDNTSLNGCGNVHVSRRALADDAGTESFAIRESNEAGYGRHGFATGEYDCVRTIDVETVPGDRIASDDVPAPNVVKIDVEGAEALVLDGLEEILGRDACRFVMVETHEPNPVQPSYEDFGATVDDLVDRLEAAGFEVSAPDAAYHLYARKTAPNRVSVADAALSVSLTQGDIADQQADAIVNSAGTSLRMGSGVAGSLRAAGGEALNRAAVAAGPVDPGEAVVTDAGALDAEYVVHAASMPHFGDGRSTPETIRQSVAAALRLADERGCESVALPATGCGLGGASLANGAQAIAEALVDFEPTTLSDVTVVAYTPDEYTTIERIVT